MKKPVGAFLHGDKGTFTVWAPNVSKVELEWHTGEEIKVVPLHRDDWGYWTAEVPHVKAGDRYGFRLDDSQAYPDPASRWQPDGVMALSAVTDSTFHWSDQDWKGISMQEMILYELHTGTFTEKGTFQGIIDKLDYLLELGINTIELMPVAQFPGLRNWGYDGVFLFAVQHSYGGIQGLKELVNACHQKGIAVFLDVVYNHIGPEGNHLYHYGPYFTNRYQAPWGQPFNVDGPHSDHVRDYFIRNALMWFDEFHIDGLRLDATDHIWDFSALHFLQELSQEVARLSQKNNRPYLLVAESDLNDPKLIRTPDQYGFGLSGQWLDNFHHAIHALATADRSHYYEDFGELWHLHKAFNEVFIYNGTYSTHRKKIYGTRAEQYPCHQFVVFSQNHDQIGNRLLSDRLSTQVSPDMLKVIAGTCILSPYVPLLFMGEEYGETHPFFYFIHHGNLELIEAVRTGRKKEFMGFQKDGFEYADPQSEDTFAKSRLSWNFEDGQRKQLWEFYRKLIALRKSHPAFRYSDRCGKTARMEQDKVLIWEQQSAQPQDPVLVCMANYGKSAAELTLPAGQHCEWLLDSHTFPGTTPVTGNHLQMAPETFLVYQYTKQA